MSSLNFALFLNIIQEEKPTEIIVKLNLFEKTVSPPEIWIPNFFCSFFSFGGVGRWVDQNMQNMEKFSSKVLDTAETRYSNTSQTRGSKLAKFSNSRFLSLFFTFKLAVPLLSTQIRDFCYFLSPKIREFGGITA